VSINVWRLAGDTLNVTCNFLYCNHQVHRDFLIILILAWRWRLLVVTACCRNEYWRQCRRLRVDGSVTFCFVTKRSDTPGATDCPLKMGKSSYFWHRIPHKTALKFLPITDKTSSADY
jgi:hypothetical protein